MKRILLIILLSSAFQNCGWIVDSFFPLEVDEFIGKQVKQSLLKGEGAVPEHKSEGLRKYVQSVADTILKSPAVRHKDVFSYKVTILKDDDTINAICAPGGYIFVYTGLLRFVEDEATLGGILAHEIAHAEERHSTKQLSTNITIYFILYSVLSYVLGPDLAGYAADIAGLSTNLVGLANSRSAESEADQRGFEYMLSTAYYPGAIGQFFTNLGAQREKESGEKKSQILFEKYLSTHPLDEDRIAQNQRMLKEKGVSSPKKEAFFKERYRSKISQYLKKLED